MRNVVRRQRTFKPLAIATAILVLLFAALPTTTVLVIGMAPTLGAFIGDTTPGRYLTKCVAGLNFAGVFPFLYQLWTTSNDMSTAIATVTDMYAWLIMYCAAAIGWLLFLGLPGGVSMFRTLNAKRRIYVLCEQQKDLLNEWGESIVPAIDRAKNADGAAAATPDGDDDAGMERAKSPA